MPKVIAKGRTVQGKLYVDGDCVLLDNGREFSKHINLTGSEVSETELLIDPEHWLRDHVGKHAKVIVVMSENSYSCEIKIGKENTDANGSKRINSKVAPSHKETPKN